MSGFELEMNEYLPLRDVVFQTLRQAILRGELKPGERLMEIHLAQKLGVSRTPVREAIRKLELEGLVLMIPRKGAIVAEITVQDLEDVLEVRMALEELAVKIACKRITQEQLEEILEILTETVCTTRQTVRVAGNNFPVEIVKSRLLKLTAEHIRFVLGCLSRNTTKIRNIRQYLLTTLYNAPTTIDNYYAAMVSHDLAVQT